MQPARWSIALLAVGAAGQATLFAQENFNPVTVIPRPFPAITKFTTADVTKAKGDVHDAELVLGVVVGKEARAYPINMLTGPRREILNDTLGGKAIAATW